MGLTKLKIGAYRSLREVEIDGLGRVNLLVGGNNAGKTSVLEAIGLVARPFDPGQWVQTATNRDASGSVLEGLWALFPGSTAIVLETGDAASAPIDICAALGEDVRHLTAVARVFVEQWADLESARPETHIDAVVRIQATVRAGDGAARSHEMDFHSVPKRIAVGAGIPPLRVFVVTPATHRLTAQLVTHLSYAINTGTKDQPVELLRLFDPDVKDVMISRSVDRDAVRVECAKKGVVDLSTFGDGMRRAFAMSLALSRASGGLLLVDEIESTVHARKLDEMLPWLFRAAEAADVQIVATTHSLEAIDAVLGAFANGEAGVVTYHLRPSAAGHVCRRYDLAGLRDLREEGLDIR